MRIKVGIIAMAFSAYVMADQVSQAYDDALAAGRVALSMQKQCEAAVQKDDYASCAPAKKAYALYDKKSRAFMSLVKPAELFQHVTPKQMDDLTAVSKEIGASLDYVNAYMDTKM